jgi:hypothetical protein
LQSLIRFEEPSLQAKVREGNIDDGN